MKHYSMTTRKLVFVIVMAVVVCIHFAHSAHAQQKTSDYKSITAFLDVHSVMKQITQPNPEATLLKRALASAIDNNPDFLAAKADHSASVAEYDKSFGALLPKIDLLTNVGGTIVRSDTTIDRYTSEDHSALTNEERLSLSQYIWDGGYTTGNIQATELEADSKREQMFNKGETILLQATEKYIDVLRYRGQLQLCRQNIETHEAIVSMTQARYDQGAGNMADVAQAKASLAEAEARSIHVSQSLEETIAGYTHVFGQKPGTLTLPTVPALVLPESMDKALSFAMDNNYAIKAALLGVQKREQEVRSAKGLFYPQVNLEASSGRSDNTNGYTGSYYDHSAGISIQWNIFKGNSDSANLRKAQHQLRQAQNKHEEIRRSISEEVRKSWAFMTATKKLIPELRTSVSMNRKALDNYIAQFRLGRRTLLDVLSAEKSLFNAQQTLLNAYMANAYAHYRLLLPLSRISQAVGIELKEVKDLPIEVTYRQ